jgi:hypothetical protein
MPVINRDTMTTRQQLKSLGLDYHKIAEFFGYENGGSFANSTRRKQIEEGILKVINHVK